MPKKKPEPKEEVLCSHDGESMTLCKAMSLCVRGYSIPVGGKIKPGLYIAGNMMHIPTTIVRNRGPVVYGPDEKGVYLNVCPWCSSDLVENWHKPVEAFVKEKTNASMNMKKARASKSDKGENTRPKKKKAS